MRGKWIVSLTAILTVLTLVTSVLASGGLLSARASEVPEVRITMPDSRRASAPAPVTVTPAGARTKTARSSDGWVHDDEKTWTLDTPVNIFRVSYPGNGGEPTVVSAYGDKVIAPGTAESYNFYIENNGSASMDFRLTAEGTATVTLDGEEYTIPLEVKLSCYDGRYLVGSGTSWETAENLDSVLDEGTVARNHFVKYTLEWQWPFEQADVAAGDAYDTCLGNLAAEGGELEATIRLNVVTEENPNPDASGGLPKTGDNSHIGLWTAVMVVSFLGLIFLLTWKGRDLKREN